jgi:hypothetical protein
MHIAGICHEGEEGGQLPRNAKNISGTGAAFPNSVTFIADGVRDKALPPVHTDVGGRRRTSRIGGSGVVLHLARRSTAAPG